MVNGDDFLIKKMQEKIVKGIVDGTKLELIRAINEFLKDNKDDINKKYRNKKETAEFLGISTPVLDDMIRKGLAVSVHGRVQRIDIEDVIEYMDKHKI